MRNIIYYIVAPLGVIFFISSVQFKKKKDILLMQMFASFFYAIGYFVLGAYSGFLTELLEQIKDFTFYEFEAHNKNIPFYFLFIFICILLLIGSFTYAGIASLAPLLINLAYFISSYFKNPKYIRIVVLICGLIWAYYNISVGAYVTIIGNVFEVVSASIAIWRYHEADKQK